MKMDKKEKLVQRINELWFDITNEGGEGYDETQHPEMVKQEEIQWRSLIKKILMNSLSPKKILDIGTGTGFVPKTVMPILDRGDTFVCTDISKEILRLCKKNLEKSSPKCKLKFAKIGVSTSYRLPFKSNSIDIITMCSVLHHIYDISGFLKEIERVLKNNGLFIIGHEPNQRFRRNFFLNFSFHFLNFFKNPQIEINHIFTRLGLGPFVQRAYGIFCPSKKKEREKIVCRINKSLKEEGLIKNPLTIYDIRKYVEYWAYKGFEVNKILPKYKTLYTDTYFHMSHISSESKNKLIKSYDSFLKKLFPKSGSLFFTIKQKRN